MLLNLDDKGTMKVLKTKTGNQGEREGPSHTQNNPTSF